MTHTTVTPEYIARAQSIIAAICDGLDALANGDPMRQAVTMSAEQLLQRMLANTIAVITERDQLTAANIALASQIADMIEERDVLLWTINEMGEF